MESKSALSWNSIPILLRISKSSRSFIAVRSRPKAKTLPASGLTSPRAVLRSTVLPLPAAPRMTRDSPSKASKEISASASVSSKRTPTWSKRRTGAGAVSGILRGRLTDEDLREHQVEDEDEDRRGYHRLGRRAADPLRSAGGPESEVAPDHGYGNREHERL